MKQKMCFLFRACWHCLFFSTSNYFLYSQLTNFDKSVEIFTTMTSEGDIFRRISFSSLGLLSIISLMSRQRHRFEMRGAVSWLLLFFLGWSFVSLLWSLDSTLTIRRFTVLCMFSLAGLAMAGRFSIRCMPLCTFFISGLYLSLGISAEIILGTFHPFSAGYRFAGTMHPNIQGINCALLFLSALYLAGNSNKKGWFFMIGCAALIFLILTGSRTSFASALVAQTVLTGVAFRKTKTILILLACVWVFGFLYIILGSGFSSFAVQSVLLGRGANEVSTLTGRTFLWKHLMDYIGNRPLVGYGFGAFWTTSHIREFSSLVGIGIMDALQPIWTCVSTWDLSD